MQHFMPNIKLFKLKLTCKRHSVRSPPQFLILSQNWRILFPLFSPPSNKPPVQKHGKKGPTSIKPPPLMGLVLVFEKQIYFNTELHVHEL